MNVPSYDQAEVSKPVYVPGGSRYDVVPQTSIIRQWHLLHSKLKKSTSFFVGSYYVTALHKKPKIVHTQFLISFKSHVSL